jgi:glycosyltransferase involved in cell wall biosynthesis
MPHSGNDVVSKVDLHVHSKHSDRPSDWFLRRIGSPESFVEPSLVYKTAKARGMDFVTISDHNCINGALEIAHLPGTFISNEVTTYFPDDGCKVHCLVFGIDETQFAMIQELRENIFELQRYLVEEDIVYSVAHPFYRVNDRLTADQVEILLLLFNRFEGVNGTRDRRAADLVNAIFRNLDRELIDAMADRHGIEPLGKTPWIKTFTGGSDDHSGLYVGNARTVTPKAPDVATFLDYVRQGRHEMEGDHGGSLLLAHCIYHIGFTYYRERFLGKHNGRNTLLRQILEKLLDPPKPSSSLRTRLRDRLAYVVRARQRRQMSDVEKLVVAEFQELVVENEAFSVPPTGPMSDRQTFEVAARLSHTLAYAFVRKFEDHIRRAELFDSLQSFVSLGPVALGIAPYLLSFANQHKDEAFLKEMARRFPAANGSLHRSDRKVWLTDTFSDVNGVAMTIRNLVAEARISRKPLNVVTCSGNGGESNGEVVNFEPVGEFTLPEYEHQAIAFPPFLNIVEYIERERFSEVIISTPGPVGLVGLLAARLLGLPTVGIYHTDFPAYVARYTDDARLINTTWRFMLWFYDQMDVVLVPSQPYRRQLLNLGIQPSKLVLLERGVDLQRFNPARLDPEFWRRRGLDGEFTYLYVGRVSKEKNLDALLSAHRQLEQRGHRVNLAIVGDGPMLKELKAAHGDGPRVCFTGYLFGEDLARAYASSDAFVFPSVTDTFGNVVLEAFASGVPAIVSNVGGPADIVGDKGSALIFDVERQGALADTMERLLTEPELGALLADRGQQVVDGCAWSNVLEKLWTAGRSVEAGMIGESPAGLRARTAGDGSDFRAVV